jgi:hypothetical protein
MSLILDWDPEKNNFLKNTRNICFEDIEDAIINNEIIDIVPHFNQQKYLSQELLIVNINGYICYVPFIIKDKIMFLETIIPSRKYNKNYAK